MRARCLLIAVAAGAMAACGAQPSDVDPGEPPVGQIPSVRTAADITLPLDAYLQTAQRQRAVQSAVTLLGRECMQRLGLDWPVDMPASGGGDGADRHARRYSIIDPARAAVDGYHPAGPARARQADQAQRPEPSREAMNVWAGRGPTTHNGQPVPQGGCAGEAVRRLTEGVKRVDPGLPQQLQMDSFARARADSRVVQVFGAWSMCMRDNGFDYQDPYAAAGDQRWQTTEVTGQEIATAVADVACKEKVGLAGTMLAVERAYQSRLIEQRAADLNAVKAFLEAEAAAAARVVAGGAPR